MSAEPADMPIPEGCAMQEHWPAGRPRADATFEAWVTAIRPRLVGLARRFLWNTHDAEEVAQEALGRAWDKGAAWLETPARNAWCYRTVINLCLSRRRKRKETELPAEELAGGISETEAVETAELSGRVRLVLAELPDKQRAAVILRDIEELGYEDIAAILATSAAGARLLVHRGRETVREILLGRWPESFKS